MTNQKLPFEQFSIAKQLIRWTIIILPVSIAIGLLVALFLWLLDIATTTRWQHLWLIFFLPLAGILIGWLYKAFGKNAEAGTNLIMDEIHEPGAGVTPRMAPLVLITTVITHLFGGSAGREGTAVQMGGSIASLFAGLFKLENGDRRILLMCGISAGFWGSFWNACSWGSFCVRSINNWKCKIRCTSAMFNCSSVSRYNLRLLRHSSYPIPYFIY